MVSAPMRADLAAALQSPAIIALIERRCATRISGNYLRIDVGTLAASTTIARSAIMKP